MLSAQCVACLVNRQLRMLDGMENADEYKKALYMRDVLEILRNMGPGETSPVAVSKMDSRFFGYFGTLRSFDAVKEKYNKLLLEKEDMLYKVAAGEEDSLLCALKLAEIGNYIDFGALSGVDDEKLEKLILSAPSEETDMEEYRIFSEELSDAGRLVFLTDNCGEIIFDKILIRIIREKYPDLIIDVIARGRPVLNDATVGDVLFAGIDRYARVSGNGSGIAGTYLPDISEEARNLILSADIIIAKGQGNFETLYGCGLNVYYAFLCKCLWFEKRFGMKKLEAVFTNERRKRMSVEGSYL